MTAKAKATSRTSLLRRSERIGRLVWEGRRASTARLLADQPSRHAFVGRACSSLTNSRRALRATGRAPENCATSGPVEREGDLQPAAEGLSGAGAVRRATWRVARERARGGPAPAPG